MSTHQVLTPPSPAAPAWRGCAALFPGRRDQIHLVRALLAGFLHGCPAADDAILLISELAANACTHSASGTPGGMFTVRAEIHSGTHVCAEVEDQGSSWDGSISATQPPHGLFLLRELSSECGTRRGRLGYLVHPRQPRYGRPGTAVITLDSALETARQTVATVARRAAERGYYSGARTEIINSHAELRAALDMLIRAAERTEPPGSSNAAQASELSDPGDSVTESRR